MAREILCIIPARGGSKGIPHKNIRSFGGVPLLAHTIRQAHSSQHITRTIVSTDDQEIADVAKEYGAEVPFLRPAEFATDTSQVADTIIHLLATLKETGGYEPDYVVMLQTTSPLRTVEDIDQSLDLLFETDAEVMMTLCESEQLLYTLDSRHRMHLVSDQKFLQSTNRQALEQTYVLNGAMVYGVKTSVFLRDKSFFKGDMVGYVIPGWRSPDLDEPADFIIAELIYKNLPALQEQLKNFK